MVRVPFNKSKKFKRLSKIWAKKLFDSGFQDIEKNEYRLKHYDSTWASDSKVGLDEFKEVQEYHSKARDFMNTFSWDSEFHKWIWEKHVEGKSAYEITLECNLSVPRINAIILKYKKVMNGSNPRKDK